MRKLEDVDQVVSKPKIDFQIVQPPDEFQAEKTILDDHNGRQVYTPSYLSICSANFAPPILCFKNKSSLSNAFGDNCRTEIGKFNHHCAIDEDPEIIMFLGALLVIKKS